MLYIIKKKSYEERFKRYIKVKFNKIFCLSLFGHSQVITNLDMLFHKKGYILKNLYADLFPTITVKCDNANQPP